MFFRTTNKRKTYPEMRLVCKFRRLSDVVGFLWVCKSRPSLTPNQQPESRWLCQSRTSKTDFKITTRTTPFKRSPLVNANNVIKKCPTFGKTMCNWARYLIFFQYIGTKYRGAVKVPPHQLGRKGVQDHLEDAIRRLRPLNPVSLSVSSRTDTGVHALSNSAHFDLQRKNDKPPFTEDVLVEALNFHLKAEQIRVTRAHRVPDDFHARFRAQSRSYVYRIALGIPHHSLAPLTDCDLCWNVCSAKLDVGAMRKAAALLVGTRDFSSFRAVNSDMHFKSPVKTLDEASVKPGSSFVHAHFHREIPFWELTFTSRSFLYKQVRRMTGALVAVGQGRISVPQLQDLLEARDSLAYPQGLVAPAHGLFLTRVDYRESDLQLSQQTPEEQFISRGNSED